MLQCPSPGHQPPVIPCCALVSLQDALLSLGAALDATTLRDALRHALVTLLPAVVGGGCIYIPWGAGKNVEQSILLGWVGVMGLLRPPGLWGAQEGVESGLSAG